MSDKRHTVPAPWLSALAATGLLLAVSWRYGYHRDELYFLEAGMHHLAWGYVDQPPFAPAVGWLATNVLGSSPSALRALPALSDGAVVLLTGLCARELGGGRYAQGLAALGAATVGVWLGGAHLLSTTPFDVLAWATLLYLVIRIISRGDERLWLAAGAVTGVGMLNKWNVAFLAAALGIGLLLSSERRRLASPWLAGGVLIATLIWLPNVLWEADNGWSSLTMLRHLHRENVADDTQVTFIPAQILYVGPILLPIWIAGLGWLARNPLARPYRAVAIAFGLLVVWYLASAGKPYYISGIYVALIAAGAVATEEWLRHRHGRFPSPRGVSIAIALGAVPAILIALPILPASSLKTTNLQSINYDLGEQIGWPRIVTEIAGVYDSLPATTRSGTVILTSNYGEAGAIDRYGPALGLPSAYSGHNNYWQWGPPAARRSQAVVAIGFGRRYLHRFFDRVRVRTRLSNGLGVSDDEEGLPVAVCRDQRGSWAALWPRLRHYG